MDDGSRMTRECHVRFCKRLSVKFRWSTYQKNGFCLWYKSLEKERFKWPADLSPPTYSMDGERLNRLLDGFDLWRNKPHERLFYQSVG